MMNAVAFVCGLVFAIGLVISGMSDPNKVLNFLDFAGTWDPSLAFVMAAGIGVHTAFYFVVVQRDKPLFGEFHLPTRRDIDAKLVAGAAMFGVGWGLSGFCPGPALVNIASLGTGALTFAGAMFVGMALFGMFRPRG
jgi:uncharacterized protein